MVHGQLSYRFSYGKGDFEKEKGKDEIPSSRAFSLSSIRHRWALKTTPPVEDGAHSVEVTMPWGTVPSESLRAVKTPRKLGAFWRSSEQLPPLNKDRSHRRAYLDERWGNPQESRLKARRKGQNSDETIGIFLRNSGQIRPSTKDQVPPRGTPPPEKRDWAKDRKKLLLEQRISTFGTITPFGADSMPNGKSVTFQGDDKV